MSENAELELRAGAAAAHVLGAELIRRDVPGTNQVRDFDLVFPDGSLEPLEITRHVNRAAYETWERLRSSRLETRSLKRVWALALPNAARSASVGPYDVRRLVAEIESVLAALEAAGFESIELGSIARDPNLRAAFTTLVELGVDLGTSRVPVPGEAPHVSLGAPVGGVTHAGLIAAAVEAEAGKPDNQTKLASPRIARRRHLFVVFDSSSGSAFNAVDRQLIGRLPRLPAAITTVWAATGPHVLVVTPPEAWCVYELPRIVFEAPESFLA